MPVEAKPLFRPDVLRPLLAEFRPSVPLDKSLLGKWAAVLSSPQGKSLNEKELLPDFLTDIFCGILGYTRIVDRPDRFTFSREKHVQVDGKYADGVIGEFRKGQERFVAAIEGKGPTDPLDRPHAGRKMSAVDQGYRYAINLRCDWVIVTSMTETRLYHKGSDQHTYERFHLVQMAEDQAAFKKFLYLLAAERVVPETRPCHFEELLAASEQVGLELTKDFYLNYADMREQAFERLAKTNPKVPRPSALQATQKLLDRVLFCCFSEDRGLLPPETVHRAYEHKDPYNPRPIYENFRGLFRSINAGNPPLGIPAYNGGLFAEDSVLDTLTVPNEVCEVFQELAGYDYRSGHEIAIDSDEEKFGQFVDVDVLGHIFEQSISDLERLHAELEGLAEPLTREQKVTRRKKEGAFYTPSFVTRYIVTQALGGVLRSRFEWLRLQHSDEAEGTARQALANPAAYDQRSLNRPQRTALTRFWEEWQEELGRIRVLDPACGSGAFLLQAFDQLHSAYERTNDRLEELRGSRSLFDLDRQILQKNLFGVDLNEEAIQICRLSLWIKTAERGKVLTSLDETIRAGNSIVSDSAVAPNAINWQAAFPHVFQDGGFDVVVGNPPYVRQEWLSSIKPYLQANYGAFHGMADLYVYFYELGLRVLRPGGRLGFVVTNKWMKTGYGEPLRTLFAGAWVQSVVDFGHAKQIFPDADVFPSILIVRKPDPAVAPPDICQVCSIPREQLRIEDLSQQVEELGFTIPRARLAAEAWSLEPPAVDELLAKIARTGVSLVEFAGTKPCAGFATGLNEAFIIDTPTRNLLIAADPNCAGIIKPYLRGQDINRWFSASSGLWLIFTRRGIDIDAFPSIREHLEQFRAQLEPKPDDWEGKWSGRKGGSYKWFEVQDSVDYWQQFEVPKIMYPDLTWTLSFCLDNERFFASKTLYFLPTADLWLLAVLNSPLAWWYAWRKTLHGKDETLRYHNPFVEAFPVPSPSQAQRAQSEDLVSRLTAIALERQQRSREVHDWLRVEFEIDKPNLKLQNLVGLTQDELVAEVRKLRGKANLLSPAGLKALRNGYEQTVRPLIARQEEAEGLERLVSGLVNEAFGLTPAEVDLMKKTAPPRMPPG